MIVLYWSVLRIISNADAEIKNLSILMMYPIVSITAAIGEAIWLYLQNEEVLMALQYAAYDLWILQGVFFLYYFLPTAKGHRTV